MSGQPSPRVHRNRLIAFACFVLLLGTSGMVLAAPAYAAGSAYWVDRANPACSDTGTGTQAAPFCTITAATKKAVTAGDTVHIEPGTYREQVTVAGSGTASDPITLVGDAPGVVVLGTQDLSAATWSPATGTAFSTPFAPPSAPRQVYVDGNRLGQASSASTTASGTWFYDGTAKVLYVDLGGDNPGNSHAVEAGAQSFGVTMTSRSNVVVSNLETRWQNFSGVRALSSSAVTIDQVTATGSASNGILVDTCQAGIVVRDSTVSGSLSTGIRVSATTGAVVRGSTSHHNGLHGIGTANAPSTVIDHNTTYRNVSVNPNATGVGIDVDTSSPNSVVTRNVSHDNQDSGFQAYAGSNGTLMARNIAYSNGDHGFDTLNTTGVRYSNNTSWNNKRDGISIEGSSTGATVANNVLADNGSATNEYDLYVDPQSTTGLSADHDLAFNDDATPAVKVNGTVYKRISDYAAASGQETHAIAQTPAFVDPAGADFHLQGGSPATDAADTSVDGYTDTDADGHQATDDPLVPDSGTGSPAYADLGALELQPDTSATDYAPHAAVLADPTTLSVPPSGQVTADGRGSADADTQPITAYSFDYGDGSAPVQQASAVSTHKYAAAGSYTITLTVTDAAGRSDSATAHVDVTTRTVQTFQVEQTSPSCSDTGSGTTAAPFCSISAALKKALAGDTVLVGAGNYREQVAPPSTGESGAPLTIKATSPDAVIVGSDDLSDNASWSPTGTSAWSRPYDPVAAPTQVWLDGQRLVQASSATTTTAGSWYYDSTARVLYVDTGGDNPASGRTVEAGARNFGVLLRNKSSIDLSGFTIRQTNLAGLYVDTSDHVTGKDLTVRDAGSYGLTVDGSTDVELSGVSASDNLSVGVRFNNSTDSTLTDADTDHNALHGVSLQGSRNVVVTDVTSYANKKPGTRVAAGIDVSLSSVDCIVQDSTTYDNDDSGLEAYTGSTGTVFRRNLTYDNNDHGIDNSAAPGSVVVANTVVGNATAGINLEGSSTDGTVRDNIATDNAVGSTRTVGDIRVDESSAAGASLERDLVFQSSGGPLFEWNSQPYGDLPAFQAASSQEHNGIAANPRFRDVAGRDLHLSSTSPAIDAAYTTVSQWAHLDREGNPPSDDPNVDNTGTGPDAEADLGAYEYGGPVAVASATPTSGSIPLDVAVDGSASVAGLAAITSATWDCGNGTTVNAVKGVCSYTAVGTYTTTFTVTDASGRSDTWSTSISARADLPPVASLVATPATGYAPQKVTLDASGSTDGDNTPIASYAFACGNGQTTGAQQGATATCTYTAAGTFTGSVTVRDTAGNATSASVKVTIAPDAAPVAALTATPTNGWAPQDVVLDASGSTDRDNTPVATYAFNCGNGTTVPAQSSPTAKCTYPKTGNFTVSVTVRDTAGLTSTKSVGIKIAADAAPKAVLSLSTTQTTRGTPVTADGSGSTDVDNTPIATYRFDCGNGVTVAAQAGPRTTCSYTTAGKFTVKMWVADTAGRESSATKQVSVK